MTPITKPTSLITVCPLTKATKKPTTKTEPA